MNISGINFESVVDGEGVRIVVFVSGCLHNCKGCHNPTSHSFEAGRPFTEELQDEIIDYINKTPFISGATISGGDPMYSAKAVAAFVRRLKTEVKDISLWIYSGFRYENILQNSEMLDLLKLCDVLVDGEFQVDKKDTKLLWKGSSNQRVIDVQNTLKQTDPSVPVLHCGDYA